MRVEGGGGEPGTLKIEGVDEEEEESGQCTVFKVSGVQVGILPGTGEIEGVDEEEGGGACGAASRKVACEEQPEPDLRKEDKVPIYYARA